MMTIDEFKKVEMRIGKIVSAEAVEGSEKLLKLQVDFGGEPSELRQVLAGIAKNHAPELLVGKEAMFVTNLEPRKMMGMESQAMILAAHGENGEPVLLMPEKEVPSGSAVS